MAGDMCRLCLRLINKVKYIDLLADTTTTAMLKEFVPEAHLDLMENTKMCSQCVQQLEVSYNFKHGVLVNEANIQSKLKESGLKKIDLKLMLKDVAKRELKDDGYVCRMCLEICRAPSISLFDSPFNMIPYTFVKKMCQVVFALEFVPSDKPVLCDECWETLQTVYNLKKRCLKLDKRCRIYIDTNNILKLGVKDLVRFASENPLGDDHCSSDEEHFAYIKGELVTDTEMKFDSDEAFCLTSSISKIKEETTVKCELDVTSKDEEFQDEPEFIDLKTVDPEMDEVNGRDCKIEICDIKVDPEEDQILTGPSEIMPTLNCLPSKPKGKKRGPKPKGRKLDRPSRAVKFRLPILRGQMFTCHHCSHKAKMKSLLKAHMLVHQPEHKAKMFQCALCSHSTKFRRCLVLHLKKHRKGAEVFNCSKCSYKTLFKSDFNKHSLTHGTDTKVYECFDCSFKSKHKASLLNHVVIHAPDDSVYFYECTKCPYKSRYKASLGRHLRRASHVENGSDVPGVLKITKKKVAP